MVTAPRRMRFQYRPRQESLVGGSGSGSSSTTTTASPGKVHSSPTGNRLCTTGCGSRNRCTTQQFQFQGILLLSGFMLVFLQNSGMDLVTSVVFLPFLDDPDVNCMFRNSPLYRKIYVYPSPGSNAFVNRTTNIHITNPSAPFFPWEKNDLICKQQTKCGYDLKSELMQYNTEILVKQLMTHPSSCLTTDDPEQATLFYVPYMPSAEFHNGTGIPGSYDTSPYGQAILDLLKSESNDESRYSGWEQLFGVTADYWKRRNGSDHILVFSEPLHGLWHPRSRRGNFHFLHSQKQLEPPIAISVELSTSFIQMYPNCSRKNILLPYPNTDGRWFNGRFDIEAQMDNKTQIPPDAQLDAERQLLNNNNNKNKNKPGYIHNLEEFRKQPKPLAQFSRFGMHGTCQHHRSIMKQDYACTPSGKFTTETKMDYSRGYRQSTFCPCPGGDSPSAKRMYDTIHGGCIPLVISEDFVWPLTREFDINTNDDQVTKTSRWLEPSEFSIRLDAQNFTTERHNPKTCQLVIEGSNDHGIQTIIENIPATEIQRLREGVAKASDLYSWYRRRSDLPDNPLQEGILPDGGVAHALVAALAERAEGVLWPACQAEKDRLPVQRNDPVQFKC